MNEELQEQIDELRTIVEGLQKDKLRDSEKIEKLELVLKEHQHDGDDGSKKFERDIDLIAGQTVGAGKVAGFTGTSDTLKDTTRAIILTGRDESAADGVMNSQVTLEHQHATDGSTNQTFLYGIRAPIYTGIRASITSGGTTFNQSEYRWDTDELAGTFINIIDSAGVLVCARQIASNTGQQLTIDGTWPSSSSNSSWATFTPIYLGSADSPWRQGYFLGEDVSSAGAGAQRRVLRFGFGSSTGADVIGVFHGTGTPESVVTANIGSLYLRRDGGATTTLYVKTSGTGSTGWTPK